MCVSVQFCEVITVSWLKSLSGHVVRVLMDYLDHVTLCAKLKAAVMEQKQWADICQLQGDGAALRVCARACVTRQTHPVLSSISPPPPPRRELSLSAASVSSEDQTLPRPPSSSLSSVYELPAVAGATEGLHPVPRV